MSGSLISGGVVYDCHTYLPFSFSARGISICRVAEHTGNGLLHGTGVFVCLYEHIPCSSTHPPHILTTLPLPSPPLPSHFQVNLHFSLLALFSSLISPTGCVEDNGVVLPLIALTDCILVRVGVAAQLLQYLLTSPPAMEISDNSGMPCVCKCVGVWVCAVWVWEWDGEYGVWCGEYGGWDGEYGGWGGGVWGSMGGGVGGMTCGGVGLHLCVDISILT